MKEILFKTMKLSDFSKITYGYTEKSKINNKKYKYLRITDIQNSSVNWDNVPFCDIGDEPFKKYELKKGDILFARTGATTGKSFLIKDCPSSVYASYLIRVQLNNSEIYDSYIQYYFQSQTYWNEIASGISGSAQGGFNAKKLGDLKIPITSLSQQQAIVEKLDFAFDAIGKAKTNIEKNIENAKELFQSKLNEIFSQKGVGWEEKKLKDVCSYSKIKNVKDLPYIGLEHIKANTGEFIGSHEPFKVKSDTFYFNDKVLLYGRLRPYLNKIFLPSFEGHCSTEIFPVLPNEKYIDRGFLFFWFFSENINKKINDTCTGARMPRANMNEVLNFHINFPSSLSAQKEIFSQMENLSEQTNLLQEKYKQKLANLEELKKSILEKAFKGELV